MLKKIVYASIIVVDLPYIIKNYKLLLFNLFKAGFSLDMYPGTCLVYKSFETRDETEFRKPVIFKCCLSTKVARSNILHTGKQTT